MKRGIDIGDTSVRFGGRTLEVVIRINTDETLEEVVSRTAPAAKGPASRMALVSGRELSSEEASKLWTLVIPIVKEQAKKGGVT